MTTQRLAIGIALAVVLVAGAGRVVSQAVAEYRFGQGTEESVERALELDPGRALYHVGLAELKASAGEDASAHYRRAVALQPSNGFLRVRLGLELERTGELDAAERELLEAARVSGKYEPRWTLANYYFRHGADEQFWRWAQEAFRRSYGDRTPLFALCWRKNPDPEWIAQSLPKDREVRMDYAQFLIGHQQWEVAVGLLTALARDAAADQTPGLLAAVQGLLSVERVSGAVAIWNSLAGAGLIPHPALDPLHGPWITGGDFSAAAKAPGFGWMVRQQSGVFVSPISPAGLRLEFSGRQPEDCELLEQHIPIAGGRDYSLRFEYGIVSSGSSEVAARSGVLWRVSDSSGQVLGEAELSGVGAEPRAMGFHVPAGEERVRLVLAHRRNRGSVRMRGTVRLERVKLVVQDTAARD